MPCHFLRRLGLLLFIFLSPRPPLSFVDSQPAGVCRIVLNSFPALPVASPVRNSFERNRHQAVERRGKTCAWSHAYFRPSPAALDRVTSTIRMSTTHRAHVGHVSDRVIVKIMLNAGRIWSLNDLQSRQSANHSRTQPLRRDLVDLVIHGPAHPTADVVIWLIALCSPHNRSAAVESPFRIRELPTQSLECTWSCVAQLT